MPEALTWALPLPLADLNAFLPQGAAAGHVRALLQPCLPPMHAQQLLSDLALSVLARCYQCRSKLLLAPVSD